MFKGNTKYVAVDHFLLDLKGLFGFGNFTNNHIILNTDDDLLGEVDVVLSNTVLLAIGTSKIENDYFYVLNLINVSLL